MLCKVQLCVLLCLGVYLARAFTPECSPSCDPTSCPSVQCEYGTVLDLCGCCRVCGQGPGGLCAANFQSLSFYDSCVDGLVCISPRPAQEYFPGICTALASVSSTVLPQPSSTVTSRSSSSSSVVITRSATSATFAASTTASYPKTTTQAWTTSSASQPSPSSSMLVTTASSVTLTATPAPNPTSLPSNSTECKELCSVSYCSASSSNTCSARGDLAFQPVPQRGVCQHTTCGACFMLLSPECSPCPDPVTESCLGQYSTCITNFYFQNATNNAIMRLDDSRAASARGRVLCHVSLVGNTVSKSSIRRAVRRTFGLSAKRLTPH